MGCIGTCLSPHIAHCSWSPSDTEGLMGLSPELQPSMEHDLCVGNAGVPRFHFGMSQWLLLLTTWLTIGSCVL